MRYEGAKQKYEEWPEGVGGLLEALLLTVRRREELF
jgi:hypothetical protein